MVVWRAAVMDVEELGLITSSLTGIAWCPARWQRATESSRGFKSVSVRVQVGFLCMGVVCSSNNVIFNARRMSRVISTLARGDVVPKVP